VALSRLKHKSGIGGRNGDVAEAKLGRRARSREVSDVEINCDRALRLHSLAEQQRPSDV
jgi:hypothetical protein